MLAKHGTDSILSTRQSLLSRLRDWQDHDGWRVFFDIPSSSITEKKDRPSPMAPPAISDQSQIQG